MTAETVNITSFRTSDVARLARTDPSAVRRWVEKGKIKPSATTPGGHYRFSEDEVRRALHIADDVAILPAALAEGVA
jgi:excisionase family DNA binding protein